MNKIQKLLVACLATSALLPNVAIADSSDLSSPYYLTVGAGAFKMNKSGGNYPATYKAPSLAAQLHLGAGYNVAEGVRLELAFIKPMGGQTKITLAGSGSRTNAVNHTIDPEASKKINDFFPDIKNSYQGEVRMIKIGAVAAEKAFKAQLSNLSEEFNQIKNTKEQAEFQNKILTPFLETMNQTMALIASKEGILRHDSDDLHKCIKHGELSDNTSALFTNDNWHKNARHYKDGIEFLKNNGAEHLNAVAEVLDQPNAAALAYNADVDGLNTLLDGPLSVINAMIRHHPTKNEHAEGETEYAEGETEYAEGETEYAEGEAENAEGKITAQINSVQLRAYVDVFDISDFGKAYVGAGLGWAQVKAKLSLPYGRGGKTKNSNNIAWFLGFGAAFDVADGIKAAVEYNYQDFGHAKFENGNKLRKKSFAGHAVMAKLMFAF